MSDFAYALRLLRRSPLFTATALLTLALGIGATTAMFSVVHAVLLQPLPYPEPDQLVQISKSGLRAGSGGDRASYPDFEDYRDRQRSLAAIAIYRFWAFTLAEGDRPESLFGLATSPSLFDVLKVPAHIGRTFRPDDDEPGRNHIVIVSFAVWQRRFGADPALVGREVRLDGKPMIVVGVMPPGFTFPMTTPATGALATRALDFWIPLPPEQQVPRRSSHNFEVVARLAPGVTLDQARDDFARIGDQLAREYPETNRGTSAYVAPLSTHVVGSTRTGLLILSGAIGFVLLMACVNVANLQLARAATREREMAVRTALGAAPGRITRQLLSESLVMGMLGGAIGCVFAWWSLPVARALAPDVPRLQEAAIDWRVAAFALTVSLAAGALVGLLPARRTSRLDFTTVIKRAGSASHARGPKPALIVVQVALSMLLLSGAGLLLRSFVNLLDVDLGFQTDRVLTGWIMRPTTTFGDLSAQARFFDEVVSRLEDLPGVTSVGAVNAMPLTMVADGTGVGTADAESLLGMDRRKVTPNYFRTLQIDLREGRVFNDRDGTDAPPVAVLSRRGAERLWSGRSALGRRIRFDAGDGQLAWREVVGVVDDVRHNGMERPIRETVYVPLAQAPEPFMQIAVRTSSDAGPFAAALSRVVASVDPAQAVFNVMSLDQLASDALGQRWFHVAVIAFFAALSLVLAAVGIYGVTASMVNGRVREIGIRIAVGGAPAAVLRLIVTQGLRCVAGGAVLGLAGAVAATRLLTSMLFEVKATDPATLSAAAALLLTVAALAIYLPARKALAVDPIEVLRAD